MNLFNSAYQTVRSPLYSADITLTGSAQVVLPQHQSRSFLMIQNLSAHAMQLEFGSARASATITNGAVTAINVTNAGFNFTRPPVVTLIGGGSAGNPNYVGLSAPGGASPSQPAQAHAVLTSNAVSSIVIDNPGAGYVRAPYVLITNSDLDPYGAAVPSVGSGLVLPISQASPLIFNGTFCTTDPIAVLGTAADVLLVRYAP